MKKFTMLLAVLLCLTASAALAELQVLATFYPMMVLTAKVTEGVPGVTVRNMAEKTVGCLHDYTLTPGDMKAIEEADVLVINGGGMEQFLDRVQRTREDLPVIDASAGIPMEDSAEEGMLNAHVWLDPMLAARQVQNIADGLAQADPEHAQAYAANRDACVEQMTELDAELRETLAPFAGSKIITFHEAFTYFAKAYGLTVSGVMVVEPDETPSTREIAALCDLVRQEDIRVLFVEPQYTRSAAEVIARETGAEIFELDPCTSGDGTPESYAQAMRNNAAVLKEAFSR